MSDNIRGFMRSLSYLDTDELDIVLQGSQLVYTRLAAAVETEQARQERLEDERIKAEVLAAYEKVINNIGLLSEVELDYLRETAHRENQSRW